MSCYPVNVQSYTFCAISLSVFFFWSAESFPRFTRAVCSSNVGVLAIIVPLQSYWNVFPDVTAHCLVVRYVDIQHTSIWNVSKAPTAAVRKYSDKHTPCRQQFSIFYTRYILYIWHLHYNTLTIGVDYTIRHLRSIYEVCRLHFNAINIVEVLPHNRVSKTRSGLFVCWLLPSLLWSSDSVCEILRQVTGQGSTTDSIR